MHISAARWELIEAKLRELPSLREEARRLQRLLIGNAATWKWMAAVEWSCRRVCVNTPGWLARDVGGATQQVSTVERDDWNAISDADLAAIKQPGGLPEELQ